MADVINSERPRQTRAWRSPTAGKIALLDLSATHASDVFPGQGNVFAWNIINPNSGQIFVKFYSMSAADLNKLIDASNLPNPVHTELINGGPGRSLVRGSDYPVHFDDCLCIRTCTGYLDSDVTAPGIAPIVELDTSFNQNIRSTN